MLEKGLLKERLKNKALRELKKENPRFTTTQALLVINAKCGAAKFHKILQRLKHAEPIFEPGEKGYNFDLPSEYGGGSYSMNHHSFVWRIAGIKFISEILSSEGIKFNIPQELIEKLK